MLLHKLFDPNVTSSWHNSWLLWKKRSSRGANPGPYLPPSTALSWVKRESIMGKTSSFPEIFPERCMTKPSPIMMIEAIGSIFQPTGSKSSRMFDLVRTVPDRSQHSGQTIHITICLFDPEFRLFGNLSTGHYFCRPISKSTQQVQQKTIWLFQNFQILNNNLLAVHHCHICTPQLRWSKNIYYKCVWIK